MEQIYEKNWILFTKVSIKVKKRLNSIHKKHIALCPKNSPSCNEWTIILFLLCTGLFSDEREKEIVNVNWWGWPRKLTENCFEDSWHDGWRGWHTNSVGATQASCDEHPWEVRWYLSVIKKKHIIKKKLKTFSKKKNQSFNDRFVKNFKIQRVKFVLSFLIVHLNFMAILNTRLNLNWISVVICSFSWS